MNTLFEQPFFKIEQNSETAKTVDVKIWDQINLLWENIGCKEKTQVVVHVFHPMTQYYIQLLKQENLEN